MSQYVPLNFPDTNNGVLYDSSKPSYVNTQDASYPRNLKFANRKLTLDLGGTDYGITKFRLSWSGNIQYGSICFYDADGSLVSVSDDIDSLYKVSFPPKAYIENIFKDENNTGFSKTFYVCVNGDPGQKTDKINIELSVAAKNPSSATVQLFIDCLHSPIYEYETGVHVYSPYDAGAEQSTLTTKLYSRIPISNWIANNTTIYSSPTLSSPALNYYYGYEGKVYQIGSELNRAYGTKTNLKATKPRYSSKFSTKTVTEGPKDFYNSSNETSAACVEPLYEGLGKISKISNTSSLDQPQQYRYYMGYDVTTQRESNDSVFTEYHFGDKKHYPITGFQHSTQKLLTHLISGWDKNVKTGGTLLLTALGIGGLALAIPSLTAVVANASLSVSIFLNGLIGPFSPALLKFGTAVSTALGPIGGIVIVALLALLLIWVAINWFSRKTKYYNEPCLDFLHHFAQSPYLNTGSVLYRDNDLSIVNNGYYSDGAYYYLQSAGSITNKELSYTIALVKNDPKELKYLESIKPDDPTLVTDPAKLFFLPYTSGKPMPYCGGSTIYYSAYRSYLHTTTCCDFETCDPVLIEMPYGSFASCISQADADAKSSQYHDIAIGIAQTQGNYTTAQEDPDYFHAHFTHEIKDETKPTLASAFYTGSLVVGTNLYYDGFGCQKVLDGYYATGSSSYYKTFYHTTNGAIDDIQYITTSGSSATDSGLPIIYTNQSYSSNWFISGSNGRNLKNYTQEFWNNYNSPDPFDTTTVYNNGVYEVVKGYITSASYSSFYQFPNFTDTGSVSEVSSGYYLGLNDWLDQEPFYYQGTGTTMSLNAADDCTYGLGNNNRGFYIQSKENGSLTSVGNPVDIEYTVNYTASFVGEPSEYVVPINNEITNVVNVTTASNSIASSTQNFNGFFVSNGTLMVCVDSPTNDVGIYRSTDFSNWSKVLSHSDIGNHNYNDFASSGDTILVGGFFKMWRSTDNGRNWSEVPSMALKYIEEIEMDSNIAIAVTNGGLGNSYYYYSTDYGYTWSLKNFANSSGISAGDTLDSIKYSNGVWFVTNKTDKSVFATSTPSDGTSWEKIKSLFSFNRVGKLSKVGNIIIQPVQDTNLGSSDVMNQIYGWQVNDNGNIQELYGGANTPITYGLFGGVSNWDKFKYFAGKNETEVVAASATTINELLVMRHITKNPYNYTEFNPLTNPWTFASSSFTENHLSGSGGTFNSGPSAINGLPIFYDEATTSYYFTTGENFNANIVRISGSAYDSIIISSSYSDRIILDEYNSKTRVEYSSSITPNSTVNDITLKITSSNPSNNILYTTSSYESCFTDDQINCDITFDGLTDNATTSFPRTQVVDLGSGTGDVYFYITASQSPVKTIIEWNGSEVVNTGYIGASSYQTPLDDILSDKGLSTETITSIRNTSSIFNKNSASPTTATVKFFAPIPPASWEYKLDCPT
jgi:hypothetical protein